MILITGASGLIGQLVLQALATFAQSPPPIRAMYRNPGAARPVPGLRFEAINGDFDDAPSLDQAVANVDTVLLVSPSNPDMLRQQCALIDALVRAADKHADAKPRPRPRIVKLSGFLTALDSPSQSGRWHARIESYIAQADLPCVRLRPPFFMQNLLRLCASLQATSTVSSPLEGQRIAMIDARDIAAVAAKCLLESGHDGQPLLITGPRAVSFQEVAAEFGRILARPIHYAANTLSQERANLIASGAPPWRVDVVMEFQEGFLGGHGAPVTDIVRAVTGQEPRDLAQFMDDYQERITSP